MSLIINDPLVESCVECGYYVSYCQLRSEEQRSILEVVGCHRSGRWWLYTRQSIALHTAFTLEAISVPNSGTIGNRIWYRYYTPSSIVSVHLPSAVLTWFVLVWPGYFPSCFPMRWRLGLSRQQIHTNEHLQHVVMAGIWHNSVSGMPSQM